ncbi:MAG: ATP-binding protein [Gammaproteobacteria bacterium]|nr:ATP-binding protein [Gammaproteobacteria bacterium]
MPELDQLLARTHALLDRLEKLVPSRSPAGVPPGPALRWHVDRTGRRFGTVTAPAGMRMADLQCIDRQKALLDRNTRQFLSGLPANHALLWGPRGTGKSSLIRALLTEYHDRGLRLAEVARSDLGDLPEICAALATAAGRFLLFCDDLSFSAGDDSYRALKPLVDGSVSSLPENVLIYATSNRRHLLPEHMQDNLDSRIEDGELHASEAIEDKLSLSERFGLRIGFHPFTQDQFLQTVFHWLRQLDPGAAADPEEIRGAALQWALEHGSRSGRSAWQFARDWTGRARLGDS